MSAIAARVALVTGSAQGIGRAIALNDLSSKDDQLRAVAKEIEKTGQKALLVPGDVTIEEEVKRTVRDASEHLGGLDVMVANAGIAPTAPLVSTELDDWERTMAVNARGTFLCYKYAAQQMIAQGRGGRIIGASSGMGKAALPLACANVSSKFAIRAFELGRHDITVNCYAPGPIDTPLVADWISAGGGPKGADPELLEYFRMSARPIHRVGRPEDVANLVSHVASKEAYLITGTYLFGFDLVTMDSFRAMHFH